MVNITRSSPPPTSPNTSILSTTSEAAKSWREAREMPYRLRQAVAVYLENKQFLEGFTLLNSILVAGRSTPSAPPVYIPPPSYFELAATLVVHPLYTTRAKSAEDSRAADEALRYLRDTCTVVGPVHANLTSAFAFRSARAVRRKRKRNDEDWSASNGSASDDESDDDEGLRSVYVGEKSVFRQREGFWLLVGWAFNCSVRYEKRWEKWKLWLEMMVQVLEEDFGSRFSAMATEEDEGNSGTEALPAGGTWRDKLARDALVTQYLDGAGRRGGRRRIVSAILADGGERALMEFGECWKNETKERKVKEETDLWGKQKKLDLEKNVWGDYDINEDDDEIVQDGDVMMKDSVEDGKEPDFGGIESMKLRQRLMILLIHVASALPLYFSNVEELYDVYTELLRPLPLPVFRDFLAALTPQVTFSLDWRIPLLANTILPFLAAPPRRPEIFAVTQQLLIRHYVPDAANATSIVENAKMSLLVEHLLFDMWSEGRLESSNTLTAAVEKGILARETKAIGDARRKDKGRTSEEQAAKVVLQLSAERIRMTLALLDSGVTAGNSRGTGGVLGHDVDFSSSQLSELTETPSIEDEDGDGDLTLVGS